MKIPELLKKIDAVVIAVIKWLVIALFLALTLILAGNVFIRYVPIMSLHWLDEIVELLFAALVFYGAAGVWIVKGHFSAGEMIGKLFKTKRSKAILKLFVDVASFVFIFILFKFSIDLVAHSLEKSTVFQIPKKIHYSAMPVGAGIMTLYSIRFIIEDFIKIFRPAEEKAVQDQTA